MLYISDIRFRSYVRRDHGYTIENVWRFYIHNYFYQNV